jgi:hypothetical protein
VTVLNALAVDPGSKWHGNWRWYDETTLGCCADLESIHATGIAWGPWVSLARKQGLHVEAVRASDS